MKQKFIFIAVMLAVVIYLMSVKGLSYIVRIMAEGIKEFEGWAPGSVSYRNNNPGNIKDTGFVGYVSSDSQGHAIFDTYENGWRALKLKLSNALTGQSSVYLLTMTLYQFFNTWATGNGNAYAEFIAEKLGVLPTTRLEELVL